MRHHVRISPDRLRAPARERDPQALPRGARAGDGRGVVTRGVSVDEARAAVLDRLVSEEHRRGDVASRPWAATRRRAPSTISGWPRAMPCCCGPASRCRARMRRPLISPAASTTSPASSSPGRGFATASLSPQRLMQRAMTTQDFPLLLADSLGKAIRNGYETEPASHRQWVRVVPVPDSRVNCGRFSAAPPPCSWSTSMASTPMGRWPRTRPPTWCRSSGASCRSRGKSW